MAATVMIPPITVEGKVSASISFGPNSVSAPGALSAGATTVTLQNNVGNAICPVTPCPVLLQDNGSSGLTEIVQVASVQTGGGALLLASPGCVNAHLANSITVCQVTIAVSSQQSVPPRSPYLQGG